MAPYSFIRKILLKNPMNASKAQHERKISRDFNRSSIRPEVLEG